MCKLSPKQLQMLRDFERDGEATDIHDFDRGGTLDWRNRERVIDALYRKQLLNEDGITDAGRACLAKVARVMERS
jgi:hypothetical protein